MPDAQKNAAIALDGIAKTFPGVRALSDVSLALYPGEVTALVGENGAGKSTLVKILTGIYQPDGGEITIDGAPVRFPTAEAASEHGVTAIHQETVLFDALTVAENIFIGHAPTNRFGLIDWKQIHDRARDILDSIGARIDPRHRLSELGIANRHMVAVARALSVDARVVIMDEPTAALSQKEIEELYELVEKLKADGKAILFISHKFDEIFRIADRYTVFRDGEMVGEPPGGDQFERHENEQKRASLKDAHKGNVYSLSGSTDWGGDLRVELTDYDFKKNKQTVVVRAEGASFTGTTKKRSLSCSGDKIDKLFCLGFCIMGSDYCENEHECTWKEGVHDKEMKISLPVDKAKVLSKAKACKDQSRKCHERVNSM